MNTAVFFLVTTLAFATTVSLSAQTLPGCPAVDSCVSAQAPDALASYAVNTQKSANSKYAKAAGHPNDTRLWLAAVADFREASRAIQKDVECLAKAQTSTTCATEVRQEAPPESTPGATTLDSFVHKDFSEFIRRYRNAFGTQKKMRECLAEALVKTKCSLDSNSSTSESPAPTTDI